MKASWQTDASQYEQRVVGHVLYCMRCKASVAQSHKDRVRAMVRASLPECTCGGTVMPVAKTKTVRTGEPMRPITLEQLFGGAARCRRSKEAPLRIVQGHDLFGRRWQFAVVCEGHTHYHYLGEVACLETTDLCSLLVVALSSLEPWPIDERAAHGSELMRRPICCGMCGAPAGAEDKRCEYCQVQWEKM